MNTQFITRIESRIQTSSAPLDYWIGYLVCAIEHNKITRDEYDRLNALVHAYYATKETLAYKYQHCSRCCLWRLHRWTDGRWRCCNCRTRQDSTPPEGKPELNTLQQQVPRKTDPDGMRRLRLRIGLRVDPAAGEPLDYYDGIRHALQTMHGLPAEVTTITNV